MRFKENLPFVVLFLSTIYVLFLGYSDDLDLYIHPRYIVFTIVMSLLCLALVLGSHFLNRPHATKKLSFNTLPIIAVLVLSITFPARSLTSATVTQRSVNQGSTVAASAQESEALLFSQSSRILTLRDWHRLISINTDESYYANKTAEVSGFAYDAGLGNDTFWLARFVVTCCAVDAAPIGVPVRVSGWQDAYRQDQWLKVEGQFKSLETAEGRQLVLVPNDIQAIEEPDDPYAN